MTLRNTYFYKPSSGIGGSGSEKNVYACTKTAKFAVFVHIWQPPKLSKNMYKCCETRIFRSIMSRFVQMVCLVMSVDNYLKNLQPCSLAQQLLNPIIFSTSLFLCAAQSAASAPNGSSTKSYSRCSLTSELQNLRLDCAFTSAQKRVYLRAKAGHVTSERADDVT